MSAVGNQQNNSAGRPSVDIHWWSRAQMKGKGTKDVRSSGGVVPVEIVFWKQMLREEGLSELGTKRKYPHFAIASSPPPWVSPRLHLRRMRVFFL